MSEDDLERTLRDAFTARARDAVGDDRPVPAARFASEPATRRHRGRLLAPLAAAAAVVAVVGGILTIARGTNSDSGGPVAGGRASSHSSAGASAPGVGGASGRPTTERKNVHVRLFNGDGKVYGVAMPVVAIFSARVADARPFARATEVTVDGKPSNAAWYFENSSAGLGAMEAHLRPANYWPAHADVRVSIATQGLSAGRGMVYDDSLTLHFKTGPRTIATVDDRSNMMTIWSDGKQIEKVPVSLGVARTPTMSGTKVIMQKAGKVQLTGPDYHAVVQNAQRLTYSGEYLYGAPWKGVSPKNPVDTTHGCTLLQPADAARLYRMLRVGDPVEYVGTTGGQVPPGDGFGDWNVQWATWRAGGLLKTR